MKFVKNNAKTIIIIIIAVMITSGISIYATYSYFADDISYTKANGTEISVQDALNDLYNRTNNYVPVDYIYPYQKFVITKESNGYVYTLRVYNALNNLIFEKTYECGLFGDFSSTSSTYNYDDKTYTLTAYGVNSTNNFRGEITCESKTLFTFSAKASGENGSFSTNSTIEMKDFILFQNGIYEKK